MIRWTGIRTSSSTRTPNYSPLTIGLLLHDMTLANGALGFVPGSHAGELFDQYDEQGQWKGCLNARDVERLDVTGAAYVEAGAGAITVHNCRTSAWFAPEPERGRTAIAVGRVRVGRCISVHATPGTRSARRGGHSWPTRPMGAPRPAPVPDPARLVERLHVDLRRPGRRG